MPVLRSFNFIAHATALLIHVLAPTAGAEQLAPASSNGTRLVGALEIGYDSFEERYSILDADTLDSVSEFRSRLSLGVASGTLLRNFFLLEGRAVIGEGNYEGSARLRFSRLLSGKRNRFTFETDFTRRTFTDASSFTFPNDHNRLYARSQVLTSLGESSALRLTGRLENIDFEDRTEFDYDYTKGSVTVASEFDWGLLTFFSAGLRATRMAIPDSSEIEYDAWGPVVEFRTTPGLRKQAFVQASYEHRGYQSNLATRSSFWALFANMGAEWPLFDDYSVEVSSDLENYKYDASTSAYFNYTEARNYILLKYIHSWYSQVGIGPTAAFLVSGAAPDDEYAEYGVRLQLEYSRGARAWLSASYEVGKRDYAAFEGGGTPLSSIDLDTSSVFSDYSYHRLGLFGSMRIHDGLAVNALLDYQPEDHDRIGDDATATLLSVGVSYNF